MSLLLNFGAQEAEKLKKQNVTCFVGHPVYIYIYVCALWISSPLVVYDAIENTSLSRAHKD